MATEDGEGSGGSEKSATAATSTAPDSSTLSLPQQSTAPQEHAPTRSTPVQGLEDAMSGSSSESAPRVPASDVRLQGAADTAPIEEGEGIQPTLPTETSPASGSTSTLALGGSSPAPQGQATTRSEDAIGGRSIESAPRVSASDVFLRGGGFIFQAPQVPAPDQPARVSQVFVPGGPDINIDDIDMAHVKTLIAEMMAGIAASASDTKTPPASDSTTLALTQSSSAQREHGITSSPPVHVPADAISGRSELPFLPGPSDAIFCPPPASLQPRRDVGVIGGGRPARATAGDPEMGLVPFRGHAPHAGMPPLRQPEPAVTTMVGMAPRTLGAPLRSAGLLQWPEHAPHVGGAPFVQVEPGLTRMMGMGLEWTTGQPWRQHIGSGPPGAQLQLHHAQSPLRLEHGRHHLALASTSHNDSENYLQIPLEPALTRMMGTGLQTGPLAEMLQRERARLLQLHQQYHARSTLRLELEPAREPRRHHLAIAPTRHDNSENFLQIPRVDVQRGWAELQARRQECEELRQHNHLLQKECWNLRQALRLHQTPPSRNGVCGDCFGPAELQLTPCLHYALCIECYQKRHKCPCCRRGFD